MRRHFRARLCARVNGAVEVVGMALMGRSVGHGEHIGDLVVTFKVVSVCVCVCVSFLCAFV